MGYFRTPSYYSRFRCIAGACTDSCCEGWEIDIDDDTLARYRKVKGEFGRRLAHEIVPESEDEPAHFRLTEKNRCPFLNDENLCEIYMELGEDALSQICTHHPRFYEWYADGTEGGIGLCCEAAADLILQETGYPEFVTVGEPDERDESGYENGECEDMTGETADESGDFADEETPEPDDGECPEELIAVSELEDFLFGRREELFRIAAGGTSADTPWNFDETCDRLFEAAGKIQNEYEDLLYGPAEEPEEEAQTGDIQEEEPRYESRISWTEMFWTEDFLAELLGFYENLEVNDPFWPELLRKLRENLSELLAFRIEFPVSYGSQMSEYSALLIYFIYRYFMKARLDDAAAEKVHFALISTCMIELLGVYYRKKDGELTHRTQIDLCKLYCKEIEYDEGNVAAVSAYLTERMQDEAFDGE